MLTLQNVSKEFHNKEILKNINLYLDKGIYGLLGANGAGKTTLLRCICGLYKLSSGKILFSNQDIRKLKEQYRDKIGYLPQQFGYYPDFTGEKFLFYIAALKDLSPVLTKKRIKEVLQLVNLYEERNKKLKNYSGGMLRRIGIAQALLNEPDLLILDEPSAGLDPKERIKLKKILTSYGENHTVLISTHIVSDIEDIAKSVIILKDGQIVDCGSKQELAKNIYVWEGYITKDKKDIIAEKFLVSNIFDMGNCFKVRMLSQKKPGNSFEESPPNLEDIYLYHFKEISHHD